MILNKIKHYLLLFFITFMCSAPVSAEISQTPLFLVSSVNPNVLFNMSVENPMGGAAYSDNGMGCRHNWKGYQFGTCYSNTKKYLGYFDSQKCYEYDTANKYFVPKSKTNDKYECSGRFSGNLLNWATMTAIDMFAMTMTGGNRLIDTIGSNAKTVIKRARKINSSTGGDFGNQLFPNKYIDPVYNVNPSTVSPFSKVFQIVNHPDYFDLEVTGSQTKKYYPRVLVCDKAVGLEDNCVPYDGGAYYKPEGLIQKHANTIRFGVTSYTNVSGNGIDGGVLRSNIKYTGLTMPDGNGGIITNPQAEINEHGQIISNPNSDDATASAVSLSGVIPYINRFSEFGYKRKDPASELFYESINYYKNRGPTPEYLRTDSTAKGGFPILDGSRWKDPIQYSCQKNYIIGLNDANPWADKRLPGTFFKESNFKTLDEVKDENGKVVIDETTGKPKLKEVSLEGDYGEPQHADPDINVTQLTNEVGELQGLYKQKQCIGCTATDCDMKATKKEIKALGEVFGTCPWPPKKNSYYIAGLAYYANTKDIRKDIKGKQSITTFMIDTQEYSPTPLVGEMNMLWLAGKFGGFVDKNGNNRPDLDSEWLGDDGVTPRNYVLATEPEKLVKALNNTFDQIDAQISAASSAVANSSRADSKANIYQATFSSSDWSGQLLAYKINNDGSIANSFSWDAGWKTKILSNGSAANRNVITFNTETNSGVDFKYGSLNESQKLSLNIDPLSKNTDSLGELRVNYLRGDDSHEKSKGGQFRDRKSLLGAVINSSPSYSEGSDDFGYTRIGNKEGADYITFRNDKSNRTSALYFGAGDGFLHAINAETGEELFSYAPAALISSLNKLTSPGYGCSGSGCIAFTNFVDGNTRVGDAYIPTADYTTYDNTADKTWKTILVSTLGRGGKAIFGLDVTNPSTFNKDKVLWEISPEHSPFPDDLLDNPSTNFPGLTNNLGYTISKPEIVRMNNGQYVAIVANGYESANLSAVLYIIDLKTGEIIRAIDTKVGSISQPNGLSDAIAVDINGNKNADVVYAGDLLGNLWKFDISDSDPKKWDVIKSGNGKNAVPTPIYIAKDGKDKRQPITARPEVGKHPDGGLMIYFGTGKYYAKNDQIVSENTQVQTFYGIRDQGQIIATNDRSTDSTLQKQEILHEVLNITVPINETDADGNTSVKMETHDDDIRVTSNNSVNYNSANINGWYMDLISPLNGREGERVVSAPVLRAGRIIFATVIPSADVCEAGGSSWIMEMDALNGKRLATAPFDINEDGYFDEKDMFALYDTNGDGVIDSKDKVHVSGIRKGGMGIINTPAIVSVGNDKEVKYLNGSKAKLDTITESSGSIAGRQSWRQLQ